MQMKSSALDLGRSPSTPRCSIQGSLRREGIVAASQRPIAGSLHGRAAPSPHKASTQQATEEKYIRSHSAMRASTIGTKRPTKTADMILRRNLFLHRSDWVNLGEGWHQVTAVGSGATNRVGLHSVLESMAQHPYSCLYIPRSDGAYQACMGSNPEYDLALQVKVMSTKPTQTLGLLAQVHPPNSQTFLFIFAYKTQEDYCAIRCDILTKSWQLIRVYSGEEELLCTASDESLKLNLFSSILLQVRGCYLSVDVNNQPIFTKVRVRTVSSLGGLMGIMVEGSKIALKGWKLKGLQTNVSLNRNAISATEETPYSSSPLPVPLWPSSPSSIVSGYMGNGMPSSSMSVSGASSVCSRSTVGVTSRRPPIPPSLQESVASVGASSSPSPRARGRMSLSDALLAKSSSPIPSSSSSAHFRPHSQPLTIAQLTAANPEAHVERTQMDSFSHLLPMQSPLPPPPVASSSSGSGPSPALRRPNSQSSLSAGRGVSEAIYTQLVALNDPQLVDWVLQDIVQKDIGIRFEDIAALDTAKRLLHEAIVLPIVMPEFFTGIREPWKGVLLFGPPGTGKTMLAKAVCSLQNSTFFNCSASTLVSKYRGETEKIVRVLFQAARLCAPSVIFIDELDAIMGDRDKGQEHEASRRLKTELFAQIDGLASQDGNADPTKRIVLLAASNCPWDLDPAMRRRLEKRIYIPLPDVVGRTALLEILLRNIPISSDVNLPSLVQMTNGFSGSDIQIICRDASMMPMRRLLDLFSAQDLVEMKKSGDLLVPKVTMQDFESALQNTRPSVTSATIARYEKWEAEFSNK